MAGIAARLPRALWRAARLPRAVWRTAAVTLAVGLGCLAVAGVAAGVAGLRAAGAGVALVVVFFAIGAVPLRLVRPDGSASPVALPVVLGGYLIRVAGLAAIGLWLSGQPDFDRAAFGATILICALTWPAAAAVVVLRASPTAAGGRPRRRVQRSPGPR